MGPDYRERRDCFEHFDMKLMGIMLYASAYEEEIEKNMQKLTATVTSEALTIDTPMQKVHIMS